MSNFKTEICCQRCPRIEYKDVSIEEIVAQSKLKGEVAQPPAILITVDGVEVAKFGAMCSVCREIVARSIKNIANYQKNKSATRGGDADEA
jgi:hypothetical protein